MPIFVIVEKINHYGYRLNPFIIPVNWMFGHVNGSKCFD